MLCKIGLCGVRFLAKFDLEGKERAHFERRRRRYTYNKLLCYVKIIALVSLFGHQSPHQPLMSCVKDILPSQKTKQPDEGVFPLL